jgi:WD40 repeat protein
MRYVCFVVALIVILTLSTPQLLRTSAQDPSENPIITADNIDQLTEIAQIGRGTINDVAWSPDGDWLAIGGGAGIWLYASNFDPQFLLEGPVQQFHWLADSLTIVARDDSGTFTVWNTDMCEVITTFEISGAAPRDFVISPDNTPIAVGSGRTIRIHDLATGEERLRLEGATGTIETLLWTADGHIIANDSHHSLRTWDVNTSAEVAVLDEGWTVNAFDISPTTGDVAISGPHDTMYWIDPATLEIQTEWVNETYGFSTELAFSSDGAYLAGGFTSETVVIWDAETGQALQTLDAGYEDYFSATVNITWSPDGQMIVASGSDGIIRVWGIPSP